MRGIIYRFGYFGLIQDTSSRNILYFLTLRYLLYHIENLYMIMKNLLPLFILCLFSPFISLGNVCPALEKGSPDIKSMNALTFSEEGILFIGDSKSASIFAIEINDPVQNLEVEDIEINQIDKQIASQLGTTPENIVIQDLAVNPVSKRVYLALHHASGIPVLLRLEGANFQPVNLENVSFTKASIENAISIDAQDQRGRPLRRWSISDIDYFEGSVIVSGLSNKEFSSTLSSMRFPFTQDQNQSSIEIYHAAHGQYETHAPIKTFTTTLLHDKPHIIASYTCTPLVVFPLDILKTGQHTMGRTVAELGNRNTPLDIITMEKEGNSYLLMANTSRALMKISYEKLEAFNDSLTEPVEENSATAGVDFIALPLVNVHQLAKLDDTHFLMIQRKNNGDLDLVSGTADRWL